MRRAPGALPRHRKAQAPVQASTVQVRVDGRLLGPREYSVSPYGVLTINKEAVRPRWFVRLWCWVQGVRPAAPNVQVTYMRNGR